MLQTSLVLITALAVPFVVGLPLAWLVGGCRPLTRDDWVAAPFLGLAGIILPLLNLVYLDIPIRQAVPWFWTVVLTLYACWLVRGGLAASLRTAPVRLLLACLGAYLAQGGGLLCEGVGDYVGLARGDQVNYNSMAQFLADQPHNTELGDNPREPWQFPALVYKDDRLGASVAQAVLLVTTGQDAAAVYFPLAFLGPALLVLAFGTLAETMGLPARLAAAVALGASLMPGITQIAFEYLSQALAVPLLYFLIVCLHRLTCNPGLRSVAHCAPVLACAAAVYPEFLPIYLGLVAVMLCCAIVLQQANWRRILACSMTAVLALPVLLPLAIGSFLMPFSRLDQDHGPQVFAPLLSSLPLIAWRGTIPAYLPYWRAWNAGLTLLSALAVATLAITAWRAIRARDDRTAGPIVALLALVALPLVVWFVKPTGSYQVYKLALTAFPVTVLGLAWLAHWRMPRLSAVAGLVLILLPAWGTLLDQREVVLGQFPGRSNSGLCRDEVARPARRLLTAPESSAWILSLGCTPDDTRRTAWLCWYGRHQRLWLVPPKLHGMPVNEYRKGLYDDLETAPNDVNYLTGGRNGANVVSPGDASRSEEERLTIWTLRKGRWCLPLSVRDDREVDLVNRDRHLPAGQPWTMEVYARCEGELRVSAGWFGDDGRRASLGVVLDGQEVRHFVSSGWSTVPVRIPKGRNVIVFTLHRNAEEPPLQGSYPVGDVDFEFVPAE